MIEIYAKLIIARKRTIAQIPISLQNEVEDKLKEWGYSIEGVQIS